MNKFNILLKLLVLLSLGAYGFPHAASVSDSKEFSIGDSANLKLANIAGNIQLSVGDTDRIVVSYENSDDRIEVTMDQRGDMVTVEVDYPSQFRSIKGGVDFFIEFPPTGRLRIESVSGNILSAGISGDLELSTVSGAVEIESASGDIRLNSVSGNLTMIDVQQADLVANTVSGNIQYADGNLSGDGYKFTTVSGSVDISHHAEASFRFDGSTAVGRIHTDNYGDIEVESPRYGPGSTARGNYNSGDVSVEARTVNGEIRLRQD